MTEAEWLTSTDPEDMYFRASSVLKTSRRRMDLFCLACAGLVLHLIEDRNAKQAFEWLEENPGNRCRPVGGAPVRDRFNGLAIGLYNAHHRREQGVGGFAVHVAYDFWADWYEYAFPNVWVLAAHYPNALRQDPRTYLSGVMRDIFGNPFRPITLNLAWRTANVVARAQSIYDQRAFDQLPIFGDALEEAGCTQSDILNHCRQPGVHVRGCWVIDLLLKKE